MHLQRDAMGRPSWPRRAGSSICCSPASAVPTRRGMPRCSAPSRIWRNMSASKMRPFCGPGERVPAERHGRFSIIKLGALGDFIQALGPMPDLRRHHAADRITLLTTPRYAEFASQIGLFDDILIDDRPKAFDLAGWLALRRTLRHRRFRSSSSIFKPRTDPGSMPGCSGRGECRNGPGSSGAALTRMRTLSATGSTQWIGRPNSC